MPRLNQPQRADHPWNKKKSTSYAKMREGKQAPTKKVAPGASLGWSCPNCASPTCEYEECIS